MNEEKLIAAHRMLCGNSSLDFTCKMFEFLNNGAHYIIGNHHKLICDKLDAVIRGDIDRLIVNIAPRYGKCVSPNTRIMTTKGLVNAKEIKQGDLLYTFENGKLSIQKCIATGKAYKDSVRITMRSGRIFECSTDHPMLTTFGYLEANKLKSGDRIQAIRAIVDSDYEIDDNELKFVTMMIFDGCCKYSPQFSKDDALVVEEMEKVCSNLGFQMIKIKNRCGYRLTANRSSNIRHLLEKYGIYGHLSYTKRLPQDWFALSLRQKLIFIDLMFATDGYALASGQCGITLANKGLIEDIQYLLSTTGIVSTIRKKNNDKAGAWVLTVPRSDTIKLLNMITFYQKRGMAERALEKKAISNIDTFPYEIIRYEHLTYKTMKPPYRCATNKEITRDKFVRLSQKFSCLEKYICDDFYLDRVESVEYIGAKNLIDIEIENTHNFIGNGLVSHNTLLVSQMFIAYSFAVNPASKLLHLSYSAALTMDNSMAVKDILNSEYFRTLFEARINPKRNRRQRWETTQKGGLYATSTLGQITGFGAGQISEEDEVIDEYFNDVEKKPKARYAGAIVIDDPIKPEEALSEQVRETVNRRFETTIRNRVNSKHTPIIIIMQRLHEHDLCGYLMDVEPDRWDVLSLPCIYYDNNEEKALWDFKHNLDELHELREINPWVFDTQYMQNPKPLQGLLFPENETVYFSEIPQDPDVCFIQVDPADEGKDCYCSKVFYIKDGNCYNVDTMYTTDKLEITIPRQMEQIIKWKPSYVNIESNAAWRLAAKDIKEQVIELGLNTDVRRFRVHTNKELRIFNEAPTVRNLFRYLSPEKQNAEYKQCMKEKHSYLKMARNQRDDGVDCDAAASYWAKKSGLIGLM